LRELLIKTCKEIGVFCHEKGTVITIEGPRFSTKAESKMFRVWGADVINMSIAPEAALANEAKIPYAAVAMSTDYDCWKNDEAPVTWEAVLEIFKANVEKVTIPLYKHLIEIPYNVEKRERDYKSFNGSYLSCVKREVDYHSPSSITLGTSGCCDLWAGTGGGTNFDPGFGYTLTQNCGIRVNRNGSLPASNGWPELLSEDTAAWGTMFWGVDQHNPDVDFKSGWKNWIETTDVEDAAVVAQLPTIGRLPLSAARLPPGGGNISNVLAVYKVTKSLAHCDRKRFDLKLIWARTEAYGCTFDGPKAVPSTYPSTGALFWD
jgi:hypothetical protein